MYQFDGATCPLQGVVNVGSLSLSEECACLSFYYLSNGQMCHLTSLFALYIFYITLANYLVDYKLKSFVESKKPSGPDE